MAIRIRQSAPWSRILPGVGVVLGLMVTSCQRPIQRPPVPAMATGERLYAEHCAACHGPTGEGNGPASIALKTRPRNFRRELFRYVSSTDGVATIEDLGQTIAQGRRYGEMPAHPQLSQPEVYAVADYVLEFARQGWIERLEQRAEEENEDLDAELIEEIADSRMMAEEPIAVFHPPADFLQDGKQGRELYREACAICHGPTGHGDGLDTPVDNEGRAIKVADLTTGEFRGGRSPEEIYKRIACGVPGTPMPAQTNLTDEEVWQLVYHVRLLSGMPLRSKMLTASNAE